VEKSSYGYLRYFGLLTAVQLCAVFLFNYLMDPLWFASGNVVTHQNYAFNERVAKLNLFLQAPDSYDCYIFGSSRTTLLNEQNIREHHCFNFAFSMGRIGEFTAYARYLRNRGYRPALLIVAVEDINFLTDDAAQTIPEYVLQQRNPPGMLKSYISLDALGFSYRAARGDSPYPRYYRGDFTADILPGTGGYQPEQRTHQPGKRIYPHFRVRNAAWYAEFLQVFPAAKVVFYVPPVGVWKVQEFSEAGELDNYLHAVYAVSRLGPVLYDFSIPSVVTRDVNRTYDGAHYSAATNAAIAATLNTGRLAFGLNLTRLSFADYRQHFFAALNATGQ